jgi:DNA topoisomerase-3
MKVCIAEKPSVAKDLAEVLGATTRKDGYFEGNGYQITWTFGHLCTLKEPHEYEPMLKMWNLNTLPILPAKFGIKLITNKGVEKQFNTISKLVGGAEEIINCGDAGQEGELIQQWVLKKARNKAPIKRLWISSLTEEAIKEGFENLRPGADFDNLYAAGSSRAIGDWLLGMNATRLFTLKFGKNRQVLSIGRVQTPTLALIVNRHHEIQSFEPKTYWELKTTYRQVVFSRQADKDEEDAGRTSNSYNSVEEAQDDLKKIKEFDFEVDDVTVKKGKEGAPRLFDLTSIQVECNKKINLTAEQTLNMVQGLYEKKLVTYPRVDTTYLPDDVYPKIPKILQGIIGYEKHTQFLLSDKIRKSKKVFDNSKVTDHHAIIPTGVKAYVGGVEKQVYDIITKRFLAAFYPDCEYANTNVFGNVNEIKFKATGKQILKPGWREVYSTDQKDGKEETTLPAFTKGEKGPHEPDLQEKQTQPPKTYTEASLLRAMETAGKQVDDEELRDLMKENGIGRPSTRANIIETLFRRKYVERQRKALVPTSVGIDLIDTIQNELLKSAELTGQWEHKLRQIEKGDFDASIFIREMKTMVTELVHEVRYNRPPKRIGYDEAAEKAKKKKTPKQKLAATCPKCKEGKMMAGKTAYGCERYNSGCDFLIPFELMGKKFSESAMQQLVKKGKTNTIKGLLQGEQKVEGHFLLTSDFNVEFVPKEEEKLTCPKCKQGTLMKGNSAYGCERYKEGCRFVIPFEFHGKKLSDSQLEQLVKKGKTRKIKGFQIGEEKQDGTLVVNDQFEVTFQAG